MWRQLSGQPIFISRLTFYCCFKPIQITLKPILSLLPLSLSHLSCSNMLQENLKLIVFNAIFNSIFNFVISFLRSPCFVYQPSTGIQFKEKNCFSSHTVPVYLGSFFPCTSLQSLIMCSVKSLGLKEQESYSDHLLPL